LITLSQPGRWHPRCPSCKRACRCMCSSTSATGELQWDSFTLILPEQFTSVALF
jgi:hypothetical protein